MKIVLVGGYGVFGSRLAELLLRDGHSVWVAGRSLEKAQELTNVIGGHPLEVDVRATPDKVLQPGPDVVIDATGPFKGNQDSAYHLPRLCLAAAVDYLDLSDNADFTSGISTLDEAARKQGRRLLSGASSVPGLSSIVAAELCRGYDEILLIDIAILPGNRAPRVFNSTRSRGNWLGLEYLQENSWRTRWPDLAFNVQKYGVRGQSAQGS